MSFARVVAAEELDGLPASHPEALRARRDLQRVHQVMGTRCTVLKALRALPLHPVGNRPLRILELGAGDGSLMLGVARALRGKWPAVSLTLLDLQDLLTAATLADYAAVGWQVDAQAGDALAWAERTDSNLHYTPPDAPRWDLIVANLFLHHFQDLQLTTILAAVAARSEHFFTSEPRRTNLALVGSHLIGALGVNAVTRNDAVLSVRAGFCGSELSALWPTSSPASPFNWKLKEYSAGLFSHCLLATRSGTAQANPQPDSR